MTIKELFVADLKATLEETANIMADRVILESLAKHGSITLEEAEFYDGLVRRVITEAAEEFVPDRLEIPQMIQEGEGGEPMKLTGEDGTVYMFNPATCELTPIEGAEGSEPMGGLEGEGAEALGESTEAEGQLVEESKSETGVKSADAGAGSETDETIEGEPVELTESQMIVSNLIKSLGA
jgi:hypothetical protein